MTFLERLKSIPKIFRERERRSVISSGLAHIEFVGLGPEQLSEFNQRLQARMNYMTGVKWVDVNPYIHRVVIAYDEYQVEPQQLIAAVEEAERLPIAQSSKALDTLCELADDDDVELQRILELMADIAGFWLGLGLKLVPFNPSGLGVNIVGILSLIQTTPRLRQRMDELYGHQRTDLVMNLAISLGQAISERPMSSLVGIVYKTEVLRELRARRRVWQTRKLELFSEPANLILQGYTSEMRPCELPDGPVEKYSDRTLILALSSFGLSFLATRSIRSATAALFGSLPRPAKLGRELFATELSRILSERGCLILAPDVLLRLDRIDCLVIQGSLVPSERHSLGQTVVRANIDPGEVEQRARMLFSPEKPLEVQRKGNWRLGPPTFLNASSDDEIESLSEELARQGELVLALAEGDEIVALQQIIILPRTGIEEVVKRADESGLRIVVSSNDSSIGERLGIYDTVPGGRQADDSIRKLQQQGHTVCFIGQVDTTGLSAADLSIGVIKPDQPPPWGAHIICNDSLYEVRTIMRACTQARTVSKQSVQLAMGAAIISTLVSGGGILRSPSRRVMFVVNAANLAAIFNGMRRAFSLNNHETPPARDPIPWHALEAEGVLARLSSSRDGLTYSTAQSRVSLEQSKPSVLWELGQAIYAETINPLTPLLVAGAGLSALVGSKADAFMVAGAFGITALIGGLQRFRTERAIRLMEHRAQHPIHVFRNGHLQELNTDTVSLVPGDVILVEPGDQIPADCRILEAEALEVDASTLTGESLPVKKEATPSFSEHIADRDCMLYAGTTVAAGTAKAVVVAIGLQTEAHRIVYPKDPVHEVGGVEARLRSLMHMTGPVAMAGGVGLMSAGLLRGRSMEELVDTGVSLAVAAVPEGLPLLATAAQLSAAQRLSKGGAMVRNLRCVEALGRIDIICFDKTGTITEGKVELQSVFDGVSEHPLESVTSACIHIVESAIRATLAVEPHGKHSDPIDRALTRGAQALGVDLDLIHGEDRLSELPFEAARGYHVTLSQTGTDKVLSIKGAPELILERCSHYRSNGVKEEINEGNRNQLRSEADRLARIGLRVIAVAERRVAEEGREIELTQISGYTFSGFLLFRDRVRHSAGTAIKELLKAGVRVVMLTGDHPSTAQTIANELGLGSAGTLISGAELTSMSDEALALRLPTTSVFARVTPAQKVRVIRALQRAGHVVAMAGDGANDAPPIRAADVGLAIGENSTPAARGAADIVLIDARIENLVDAIIEGRAMWVSVRNAVSILVGGNLGEIGFSVGAGFFSGRPPLNARQLLLVNFLTDIAPAIAIAVRPPLDTDFATLVNEGPEVSLGKPLNRAIASRALVTAFGAGSGWFIGRLTGSRARASTIGLSSLVCTQLGQTLVSGGLNTPVLFTSLGSTLALVSIIQTPGLSHLFGCRPLGPLGWTTAIGTSAAATFASVLLPNLAEWVLIQIRDLGADLGISPEMLNGTDTWKKLGLTEALQSPRTQLRSRY